MDNQVQQFTCKFCGEVMATAEIVVQHLQNVHPNVPEDQPAVDAKIVDAAPPVQEPVIETPPAPQFIAEGQSGGSVQNGAAGIGTDNVQIQEAEVVERPAIYVELDAIMASQPPQEGKYYLLSDAQWDAMYDALLPNNKAQVESYGFSKIAIQGKDYDTMAYKQVPFVKASTLAAEVLESQPTPTDTEQKPAHEHLFAQITNEEGKKINVCTCGHTEPVEKPKPTYGLTVVMIGDQMLCALCHEPIVNTPEWKEAHLALHTSNAEKFKTPEERKAMFDRYCYHKEQGFSDESFPDCDMKTFKRYRTLYKSEFPTERYEEAQRKYLLFWETIGRDGTIGKPQYYDDPIDKKKKSTDKFNGQSWAFNMQNRFKDQWKIRQDVTSDDEKIESPRVIIDTKPGEGSNESQ